MSLICPVSLSDTALTIGRLPDLSLEFLEKFSTDLSEHDDLVLRDTWLEDDSIRALLSSVSDSELDLGSTSSNSSRSSHSSSLLSYSLLLELGDWGELSSISYCSSPLLPGRISPVSIVLLLASGRTASEKMSSVELDEAWRDTKVLLLSHSSEDISEEESDSSPGRILGKFGEDMLGDWGDRRGVLSSVGESKRL